MNCARCKSVDGYTKGKDCTGRKDRVLANNSAGALYSQYWIRTIKENPLAGKGKTDDDK